ncbi:MAG: hypothetical protein NTX45_22240 [Proteobacteria bacterium]|nr:hypothetical protein [Pseudomonadota bacterium]
MKSITEARRLRDQFVAEKLGIFWLFIRKYNYVGWIVSFAISLPGLTKHGNAAEIYFIVSFILLFVWGMLCSAASKEFKDANDGFAIEYPEEDEIVKKAYKNK